MNISLLFNDYIIIFLAGMVGAITADILKDNYIELPKRIGGRLFLGSFGGFIIGGIAGLTIDGSLLTAFMGGFMGKEIIIRLVNNFVVTRNERADTTIEKTAP